MRFVSRGVAALLGIGIASLGNNAIAQEQDFSQVEIETIPVAEDVYMLMGEGGNIGVAVSEEGILLIDDRYAPLTEKIDASSGGSIAGMIRASETILASADDETKIIPGHGALSNRQELEAYRDMLVNVKLRTVKAIAKGQSLEDFIASKPTADYNETWGGGFLKPEDFLTIVYKSLAE